MRHVMRWWETLGRSERIVALSIGLAAPVAIANSTVWAIAVCYMVRQKTLVEIERVRTHAVDAAAEPPPPGAPEHAPDARCSAAQSPTAVAAAGHTQ